MATDQIQPVPAKRALILILAMLGMLWPALYNGQPFFNTDSTAYIRAADAAFGKIFGRSTEWSPEARVKILEEGAANAESDAPAGTERELLRAAPSSPGASLEDRTILAGRSIYYGVLAFAGYLAGDFWLTIIIQSLVFVLVIGAAMRSAGLEYDQRAWTALLVLTITPAPLYASYLMPDGFAAIVILTACILMLPAARTRAQTLVLVTVLAASLTFHSTHILIAAILLGVGLLAWCMRRTWIDGRGIVLIGVALMLAVIAELAFVWGVTVLAGQRPVRPPFLMARVIADGPGERYLHSTCPQSGFEVCRFRHLLPLTGNEFLWDEDPAHGVFSASDPGTRELLAKEQGRFVLAVLRHEPWGEIKASTLNALRQLIAVGVGSFSYSEWDKNSLLSKAPRDTAASMRRTAAFNGTFPVGALTFASQISAAGALTYIAVVLLVPSIRRRLAGTPALQLSILLLIGVAANAWVCGALSGPFSRYQARVVWLLPLAAVMLEMQRRKITR